MVRNRGYRGVEKIRELGGSPVSERAKAKSDAWEFFDPDAPQRVPVKRRARLSGADNGADQDNARMRQHAAVHGPRDSRLRRPPMKPKESTRAVARPGEGTPILSGSQMPASSRLQGASSLDGSIGEMRRERSVADWCPHNDKVAFVISWAQNCGLAYEHQWTPYTPRVRGASPDDLRTILRDVGWDTARAGAPGSAKVIVYRDMQVERELAGHSFSLTPPAGVLKVAGSAADLLVCAVRVGESIGYCSADASYDASGYRKVLETFAGNLADAVLRFRWKHSGSDVPFGARVLYSGKNDSFRDKACTFREALSEQLRVVGGLTPLVEALHEERALQIFGPERYVNEGPTCTIIMDVADRGDAVWIPLPGKESRMRYGCLVPDTSVELIAPYW